MILLVCLGNEYFRLKKEQCFCQSDCIVKSAIEHHPVNVINHRPL